MSFNGHLVEQTRPEGWDTVVKDQFVYRCDEPQQLMDYLNTRAKQMKLDGGMTIQVKSEEKEKSDKTFDRGAFVPWHMFAFVDYTIRAMSGEVRNPGEEGVLSN